MKIVWMGEMEREVVLFNMKCSSFLSFFLSFLLESGVNK